MAAAIMSTFYRRCLGGVEIAGPNMYNCLHIILLCRLRGVKQRDHHGVQEARVQLNHLLSDV